MKKIFATLFAVGMIALIAFSSEYSSTRFSNGVTNVGDSHPFANFPSPIPQKVFVAFDDFIKFSTGTVSTSTTVSDATAPPNLTYTTTTLSPNIIPFYAVTATVGSTTLTNWHTTITGSPMGIFSAKTSGSTNTYVLVEAATATIDLSSDSGRWQETWFETRLKIDDVDSSRVIAGNFVAAVTDCNGTPQAGLFFKIDGGTVAINVDQNPLAYSTISAITNVYDNTWVILSYYVDKLGKLHYFVDNTELGSANVAYPTSQQALGTGFGIETLGGVGPQKELLVDYVITAKER